MVARSRGKHKLLHLLGTKKRKEKKKEFKQEVGLPGTKLLGLSNKINNQDQP